MSKHTPGPWRVEKVNGCKTIFGSVACQDGDDGGIFSVEERVGYTHGRASEREDAANARLIAAAPDLYAVVKELVSCKRAGVAKALHLAGVAAIQKAESP